MKLYFGVTISPVLNMRLITFYCFFQLLLFCTHSQSISFVDPRVVLVPDFEGWGTSLAWWADRLGDHPQDVLDHVTSEFFSPDRLNLNIVRYVIGGTTPGITTCGNYRPGAKTPSFKDGPDTNFDWTRDQAQRRVLQIAKQFGVDTFEAFSNSPPDWMTVSKCSNGNFLDGLMHNNLDASNASAFADYATEVIRHFHDEWDITFQTYAPFNEPQGLAGIGGWLGPGLTEQEGCNLRKNVMVEIIKAVNASLESKGMNYVKITTADETQVDTATTTQKHFRAANIYGMIEKVNVHGYWDQSVSTNRRDLLRKEAQIGGHRLWMDEMGWANSPLDDMSQGMEISNRIVRDFKKLLPSAWVYWLVMENVGEWGLLGVPYVNPTVGSIVYHSGYYSMMQFSRYIKKGYSLVHINNEGAVAAYDDASKTLVIVLVNNGLAASEEMIDIRLFDTTGTVTISATRTSSTEQNAAIAPPGPDDTTYFAYSAPPKSITTFLVQNVALDTRANLILNGDFENNAPENNPWKVIGAMEGSTGGIDEIQSWNHRFHGFVEPKLNVAVGLVQNVTAPGTGYYYLTAWCFSGGLSGFGTVLGVQINGVQMTELPIRNGIGYEAYGFRFEAYANDEISVYFRSIGTSTIAYIDDAALHYQSATLPPAPTTTTTTTTTTDAPGSAHSFMTTCRYHISAIIAAALILQSI